MLISDLGYFVPSSFKQVDKAGAYFISRYKRAVGMFRRSIPFRDESAIRKRSKVKVYVKKSTEEQSIIRRRRTNKLAKSHSKESKIAGLVDIHN